MSTKARVLFVDDEANILDTFRTSLRKLYAVDTALGPEIGLQKVKSGGPWAVVVSDLKMPGMDGIEFLAKVQTLAPDTVRVMLTGFADLETSIQAVNKGQVFRFLTKPTPLDELKQTLEVCIRQYNLITAEKTLLKGTLRGSVQVLVDVLALASPEAFGRSERIKRLAMRVGNSLNAKSLLHLEMAAMLSLLGCISLPEELLHNYYAGQVLTPEEKQLLQAHPSIAAALLSNIPRLEPVIEIILNQNDTLRTNPQLSLESQILNAVMEYDRRNFLLKDRRESVKSMLDTQAYDKAVLAALLKSAALEENFTAAELSVNRLVTGMLIDQDLYTKTGMLLMARGQEIQDAALARLVTFSESGQIPATLRVLVPHGG